MSNDGEKCKPLNQCDDCGSTEVSGPDFEGFYDCHACGAAWQVDPLHKCGNTDSTTEKEN